MASLEHCHEPGLLIVLTRPKSLAHLNEFHDWYDTEHGPLRMKLDFIHNGYRYRTAGKQNAVWAALYDIDHLSALSEPRYTNLRKHRSPRERQLMSTKIDVLQRKLCKWVSTRGCNKSHAPVVMNVSFVIKQEHVPELHRWYEEEHLDDVSRTPGWRRSRRFEVVDGDVPRHGYVEFLVIHEFDDINDLTGLERVRSRMHPGRHDILDLVESRTDTVFQYHRSFSAEEYRQPPEPDMTIQVGPSDTLVQRLSILAAIRGTHAADSNLIGQMLPLMVS